MNVSDARNQEQIDYWNGTAGLRWVAQQGALDPRLEAFGRAALKTAAPCSGERVLDIGCGCGASTVMLAEQVGPQGAVVGIDVSAPMLAVAGQRTRGLPQVRLVHGDAAAQSFETRFDLLFSRFGVMFFTDPAAAFAALRRALGPAGRLAFVCWRPLAENPWIRVPLEAAQAAHGCAELPASPLTALDPEAPGPFSLSDPARVRRLLGEAGFSELLVEPFDHDLELGATLEEAVDFTVEGGPVARLLAGPQVTVELRGRMREAVREALAPLTRQAPQAAPPASQGPAPAPDGVGGVRLGSAAWIVSARG